MEETTIDVKRKMTPSIPANYVTIVQLREQWIKEKEQKQRKEQEEKDEERRRNQHADGEEHIIIIQEDPKKLQEEDDLDQKHCGGKSKKDESTTEKEEAAAIESEGGGDEGLPEKKRGRRKRYARRKKRTDQEVGERGGSIKTPEYTVKENNSQVEDQIRVCKKKEMGNKSVEKAVTAVETQFEHLSIKRGQVNKHLKAQTRSSLNRNPIETASMVWVVKKGQNDERAVDGNGEMEVA